LYIFYFIILESFDRLDKKLSLLEEKVTDKLLLHGFSKDAIYTECFLNLRYEGTDCALMCTPIYQKKSAVICMKHGDFLSAFLDR
jgi:5-oxoprolinase (ATP-hydrolysing)